MQGHDENITFLYPRWKIAHARVDTLLSIDKDIFILYTRLGIIPHLKEPTSTTTRRVTLLTVYEFLPNLFIRIDQPSINFINHPTQGDQLM